jgi:hypothetical protein
MKADIAQAGWIRGLIPLAVVTLYFVAFSLFLEWLLPEYSSNVNADFAGRGWKIMLILTAVLTPVLFVFSRTRQGRASEAGDKREKIGAGDFLLILLPLTPVVQYIGKNQDILTLPGSLYVLGVFALFSLLLVIAVPAALGKLCPAQTLALGGMAFTFMITNMASLSAKYSWLESGSLKIQLFIFGAIFLAGWLLYRRPAGRKIARFFVAGFFITNSVIQFAPEDWAGRGGSVDSENKLAELVGSKVPVNTPNIYLLVYDSCVINETMLGYGIDNSTQEGYLETLGFKLYPHTYSIGADSYSTMSRTLNASKEYYGAPRRGASGDGIVQNLLKSFGYSTCCVFNSDYFFKKIGSSYDFSFPQAKASNGLLVKAIIMGEFRFDVSFDVPLPRQFLDQKARIFQNIPNQPLFTYMHSYLPGHSQNSGTCLPNEIELFRERLNRANNEMRQDVEMIIQNDPAAIIIVAADHGPYLTKNCTSTERGYDISEITRLDIQDRFGTFLAVKWPTEEYARYDEITVLQDIFPAIFAYLFQDRQYLEAKVETRTLDKWRISGAAVNDGIICGGINDGEPLFLSPL